jgi:hypothetical protein
MSQEEPAGFQQLSYFLTFDTVPHWCRILVLLLALGDNEIDFRTMRTQALELF